MKLMISMVALAVLFAVCHSQEVEEITAPDEATFDYEHYLKHLMVTTYHYCTKPDAAKETLENACYQIFMDIRDIYCPARCQAALAQDVQFRTEFMECWDKPNFEYCRITFLKNAERMLTDEEKTRDETLFESFLIPPQKPADQHTEL